MTRFIDVLRSASFNPLNVVFSHYTQAVWRATTQLGCGAALCDDLLGTGTGAATYHVCLYDPVGNVIGQAQYVFQPDRDITER